MNPYEFHSPWSRLEPKLGLLFNMSCKWCSIPEAPVHCSSLIHFGGVEGIE